MAGPEVEVGVTPDLADASKAGQAIGDSVERAFEAAMKGVGAKVAKAVGAELRKGLGSGSRAIGDFRKHIDQIADTAKASGAKTSATFENLEQDLRSLRTATEATAQTFKSSKFFDPSMAANFQQQFRRLLEFQDRFNRESVQIAKDPVLRRAYEAQFQGISRAVQSSGTELRGNLRQISTEMNAATQRDKVALREKEVAFKAATSANVAAMQQETTRIRAENRVREAEIKASSRRQAATFQAAAREFFVIQRAMGRAATATGRTISAAFRGTGRTVGRAVESISDHLRRQNREMVTGLDGALQRRESVMRSSFRQQERIVGTSVARQSAQINRFEAQASRGLVGAATGRSSLGALLGGGLAIGGGFALASELSRLATVGADFTQGLAVLDAQLQLTDKEMASVRQTSLDLGNDIALPGVSALDAAEGIQILAKQFGSLGPAAIEAATLAAKGTLQLSRATGSTAEESAGVIGAAVNVFGIEANRAVEIADITAGALTKAAGVGFKDYAQSFKQGASVFNQFVGPAESATETVLDFNAALAVLARGGLVGSDAGTSMKQFFLQANRGTADANSALKEVTARAGEVGTVFFDQAGNARTFTDSLDILRRGIVGLTDKQRNATLQTIFGSDALRAANILVATSTEEFDKLKASMGRQGIAAELAAAQNTGLRGAMDALGSIIETQGILVYEQLQETLGRVVLGFAEFFNKLLTAGGAFATFRAAVKGAAIGLGALLAAKAAGEAIQFLGLSLRGLLTPMGLLIGGAVAIGAAIAIFADRSPEAAAALEDLRDSIGDLLSKGVDLAARGLTNLVDLIEQRVVPVLQTAATWVREHFMEAVRTVGTFIQETVVPALVSLGERIREKVLPPLKVAGEFLEERFGPALETVTDKFKDLYKTLGATGTVVAGGGLVGALGAFALGGPIVKGVLLGIGALLAAFPDLRGAFVDVANTIGQFIEGGATFGDIGTSLRNLAGEFGIAAGTIRDAITEQLGNLGGLLGDALSKIDPLAVLGGIRSTFEQISFHIVNFLTDPITLGIVASVAAALGAAGLGIIQGAARALVENAGELAAILGPALGDAIVAAFKFAFESVGTLITEFMSDPLPWTLGIAAALGALRIGQVALGAFRQIGRQAGAEVSKGLAEAQPTARGRFGTGGGFFTGLFEPPANFQSQISASTRKIESAVTGELNRLNAHFRRLQLSPFVVAPGADLAAKQAALSEAQKYLSTISGQMGQARSIGSQFRSTIFQFRTGEIGLGQMLSQAASQAGGAIKAAGASVGNALGLAMTSALSGVLAGQSGGGVGAAIGIGGIITSSLAAAAIHPALGAFTAAVGGISAVLSANANEAKKAAAEVGEYKDALLEASQAKIPELPEITAGKVFGENLLDESEAVQRFVLETGASFEDFGRILSNPDLDANQVFIGLAQAIGVSDDELKELQDRVAHGFSTEDFESLEDLDVFKRLKLSGDDLRDIIDAISDENSELRAGLEDLPTDIAITDKIKELDSGMKGAVSSADELNGAIDRTSTKASDLFAQREDRLQGQIDEAKGKIGELEGAANEARTAIQEMFTGKISFELGEAADEATVGFASATETGVGEGLGKAGKKAARAEFLREMQTNVSTFLSDSVLEGVDEGLTAAQIGQKLRKESEQVKAGINENVELTPATKKKLIAEIDDAVSLKDRDLKLKIRELTGIEEALNRAKEQAERIADRNRPKIKVAAELGDFFKTIESLPDGPAKRAMFATGVAMAREFGVGGDPELRRVINRMGGVIEDSVRGQEGPTRAAARQLANAAVEALTPPSGASVSLGARVGGDFSKGVEGTAGQAGSAGAKVGDQATAAFKIALAAMSAIAASFGPKLKTDMSGAASDAAVGFGGGLTAGIPLAVTGGAALGSAAVNATRASLDANSPSRAMQSAGNDAAAGFAQGIIVGVGPAAFAGAALGNAAVSAAQGYYGAMYSAGLSAGAGFGAGLQAGVSSAAAGAAAVAAAAVASIRAVLQIASPSKVMRRLGLFTGEGFGGGLIDSIRRLKTAIRAPLLEVVDVFDQVISERLEVFDNLFSGSASAIQFDLSTQFRGSLADVRSSLDDLRKELAATNKQRAENKLGAITRNFDVVSTDSELGRANRDNLKAAVQSAEDILAAMIEAGRSSGEIRNRFDALRQDIIRTATQAGISFDHVVGVLKQLDFTSGNVSKFIKQSTAAQREVLGAEFTATYDTLLTGIIDTFQGASPRELERQIVAGLKGIGVPLKVINSFRDEIKDFIKAAKRDPERKSERYLERIANSLEPQESTFERFRSDIEALAADRPGVSARRVSFQAADMLREIGLKVTPKDRKEIEGFIRSFRRNPMNRFSKAVEKATGEIEEVPSRFEKFGSEMESFIQQFPGKKLNVQVNALVGALRSSGVKVTRSDIKEIRQMAKSMRSDRVERFNRAIEKAAALLEARSKKDVLLPSLAPFESEISSFVEQSRGRPLGKVMRELISNFRDVGKSVTPKEIRDLREFVRNLRGDRVGRFGRALERVIDQLEGGGGTRGALEGPLGKFQSDIESFVESNKGRSLGVVTRDLVQMLRSIGVSVGPKEIKDLREFVRHLRNNPLARFTKAIDKATRKLEAGDNFVEKFSGVFDDLIERFGDQPDLIDDEIRKALEFAGLGKQAGKFAKEINEYIQKALADPGKKLQEYLDKLTKPPEEYLVPRVGEVNIYPRYGDPESIALATVNQIVASTPGVFS